MKIENEIHNHYQLLCKLILICIEKRIRLVIENPYTQPHFLHSYLPIKPSVIHTDRSKYGDTAKNRHNIGLSILNPNKIFVLKICNLKYYGNPTMQKAKIDKHFVLLYHRLMQTDLFVNTYYKRR